MLIHLMIEFTSVSLNTGDAAITNHQHKGSMIGNLLDAMYSGLAVLDPRLKSVDLIEFAAVRTYDFSFLGLIACNLLRQCIFRTCTALRKSELTLGRR